MSITTSEMTPADIAAVTGNRNNCDDGMFGGNGAWWIILFLIFAIFGWGGNGFGGGFGNGGGAAENYVLASDFATLQRQLSDGFNSQERKLDSISNGICSLGYDQLAQINGVNQNISNLGYNLMNGMTTSGYETRIAINGIGTQLADCCCEIKGGIKDSITQGVINTNAIQNSVQQCLKNSLYAIKRLFTKNAIGTCAA